MKMPGRWLSLNNLENNLLKPRYMRNVNALSAQDVLQLHSAKVCVIGVGGLGGYVVEILARIGVLNITIVDYDVFEANNLNRQLFSEEALLGTYKADAAVARIAKVNTDVTIIAIKEKLTTDNAQAILAGHDVVVDALDNIQTRLILAENCARLDIPMVHGSIAGWYGQVASVFPGDDTMQKLFGDVKAERGIEKNLGNLPFTASTIASFQCAECIKILTGKNVVRNAILHIDLLNWQFHTIPLG